MKFSGLALVQLDEWRRVDHCNGWLAVGSTTDEEMATFRQKWQYIRTAENKRVNHGIELISKATTPVDANRLAKKHGTSGQCNHFWT